MVILRAVPAQRVTVTGGPGKAGHWLVEHLVERGYDIVNARGRRG